MVVMRRSETRIRSMRRCNGPCFNHSGQLRLGLVALGARLRNSIENRTRIFRDKMWWETTSAFRIMAKQMKIVTARKRACSTRTQITKLGRRTQTAMSRRKSVGWQENLCSLLGGASPSSLPVGSRRSNPVSSEAPADDSIEARGSSTRW